jgi:hypothetical protein
VNRWFPDADDIATERAAAETLRRFPIAPRVITIGAGAGGVGVTSVGAGVAATLGTLWPGRVAYAGLTDVPALSGVHTEAGPLWTDRVDTDLVGRLTGEYGMVLLDVGAHSDAAARRLWSAADRALLVTDLSGRGEERARARADEAGPARRATVVVGQRAAGDRFGVPIDKGFHQLDDGLLDRVRPATCRALLLLAAWCM